MRKYVGAAALAVALCASARASETVSYTYDALGRLTAEAHSGTVNSGVNNAIGYDAAGNRSSYAVTGGAAAPGVSIAAASVTEGGNLVFTVTRSGAASVPFTVNYATSNGTATAGSDYTAASGTLTFAAGDTTKTITVATTNDTTPEANETLTVTLSNPTAGVTLSQATATGTIVDNDSTPISFAISTAPAVTEGGVLVYTVTKSGATASSYSVNYATANGTATAGSDYTAASGTLTFAASDVSKTISVSTINDSTPEPSETVLVNLSGATGGATVSTAQGTGTINDNDVTAITFAVGNAAAVNEGGTLVFTVTKSGSTYASTSVNYATANGTATAGSDYTAASGTLTFAAGDTSKTVSVVTIDDTVQEGAETVLLNLSGPNGGTVSTAQASGTINANDFSAMVATNPTLSYAQTTTYSIPIATLIALNGNSATITAFSVPSGDGTATIAGDGQSVSYVAPTVGTGLACDPAPKITFSIPYSVRSSSSGATVSGTASVTVTGKKGATTGACP